MTLRQAARSAARELAAAGVPEPEFEGEHLARLASGASRAAFFAGLDATTEQVSALEVLVARRAAREPAAYIAGRREFFGLDFAVTPDVLIPRPETELLVEIALRQLSAQPDAVVADIGTGSGCIAVSVAARAPGTRVVATDVSRAALDVARGNAATHSARVDFVLADQLGPVRRTDIVLANLPYIATAEIGTLEPEVRDWEPRCALDGGADGLALIRRLVAQCEVARPGLLALEVAVGQAPAVAGLARRAGAFVEVTADLAGIDRVVTARWG